MKRFIELAIKGKKTVLVNVRYIIEVAEVDESHCAIHLLLGNPVTIPIPYNRIVEMIKEAVE